MQILHVIPSINPAAGGPIEGIRQLQKPINDLGHTADVACCDAPDSPWLKDHRLNAVYALGPSVFTYGYTPRLLPWLRENAASYDAVIVNGLWQYAGLAVWRAIAGTKTPYFVFTHGMLDPWFKHAHPLKHFKKWLYWPWAQYRILRDAQAVIFTCEEERLLARESFWLYRVNEAVTSYGTSTPPANASQLQELFLSENPELRGKRIILFLGRIQKKKGCDLLIAAFAEIAGRDEQLHLVMAGPDQTGWMDELKKQANLLGIAARVSWTGMLQGELKWGAYYASEVFCLPSHQENFGIVVAEALACGKPVLISNKINIWREIELDSAGFVDNDTFEGTLGNLTRWQQLSPLESATMSQSAYNCFNTRFRIECAAERLVEIIEGKAQ